jgi:hypothetical protein
MTKEWRDGIKIENKGESGTTIKDQTITTNVGENN